MYLPSATLLAQSVVGGIFTGAVYGLLGLGLSLSWGLLHQINLAQFGLAFASAYLTYELSSRFGISPLWAVLALPPLFFAVGAALQWTVQRFRVTPLNSLLLGFGLTIIIEAALQWVWTADYRRLESDLNQGKVRLAGLYFPYPELVTLGLSLAAALAVWAMFRSSDVGKAMRAAAEDAPIAIAFGIDAHRLGLLLAGLTTALASLGGIGIALNYTLAPSQIPRRSRHRFAMARGCSSARCRCRPGWPARSSIRPAAGPSAGRRCRRRWRSVRPRRPRASPCRHRCCGTSPTPPARRPGSSPASPVQGRERTVRPAGPSPGSGRIRAGGSRRSIPIAVPPR